MDKTDRVNKAVKIFIVLAVFISLQAAHVKVMADAEPVLTVEVTARAAEDTDYKPEIKTETFGRVDIKAVITNTSTEQIVAFSSLPDCVSIMSGSTSVTNMQHIDSQYASTDNLFSPNGLVIGEYAPSDKAVVTFSVLIDNSKLPAGSSSIPINVSARTTNGQKVWLSDFVNGSATVNVKKANPIPWLKAIAAVALSSLFATAVGIFFTPVIDRIYGESQRRKARTKLNEKYGKE